MRSSAEQLIRERTTVNPWILLGFLIFVGSLLPPTKDYPYYNNDLDVLGKAKEIAGNPLAGFEPVPPYGRRYPFFIYFLFVEESVFGFGSIPYFLVLFLTHGLNAFLVTRFWQKLGGTPSASILSGLLFLCSSAVYQNLIFIHAMQRVLCIFLFLLATHSWINFLRSRNPFSWVNTMAFQVLSLLCMEDTVIFPFMALFLCFRLVTPEPGRKTVLTRYWPWLLITNVLLALLLLQSFFSSPFLAEKISVPRDGFAKMVSLAEMLVRPLLIPERGFFAPFFIQEGVTRLLPALLVFALLLGLFSKGERLKFFLATLPRPQLMTAAGWVLIGTVPFLFQNMTFEHANRYLYLPLVGFSFLFGALTEKIIETVRKFLPGRGLMVCWSLIIYTLFLGLQTISFQYQRYTRIAEEHPEKRYYDKVKELYDL